MKELNNTLSKAISNLRDLLMKDTLTLMPKSLISDVIIPLSEIIMEKDHIQLNIITGKVDVMYCCDLDEFWDWLDKEKKISPFYHQIFHDPDGGTHTISEDDAQDDFEESKPDLFSRYKEEFILENIDSLKQVQK